MTKMDTVERPGRIQQIKHFFKEMLRVLKVTKKPDANEFKTIVKASGLGIAIIGLIGFVIAMAKQLIIS